MENSSSPDKLSNRQPRPGSARVNSSQNPSSKKPPNAFPSFRSKGKSIENIHSAARPHQKSPSINRERLYEDNLSLKMKSNLLQEENTKLRTKINQIEKNLNKKEDPDTSLFRIGSKTHLIPNLKQTIKDLKDTIKTKEEEIIILRKNPKSTKLSEVEIEMQTYIDECTRLRHHLEEIMIQKQISFTSLEYEEKLFRQNMDINSLREENIQYSQDLNRAREEIVMVKDKIMMLENPLKKKKKTSRKKQELQKLKNEILEIKDKIDSSKVVYSEKETKLREEAENLVKTNEMINEKIQASDLKLQEQNIILEQLRTQMMNHEKDFKRSQTIGAPSLSTFSIRKMLNPPKLFQKIFSVISKKQMITDVFFSLMDKNSNGNIDSNEIYQYMLANGCKVKKKYIQEALNFFGITNNSIPITLFQENYDKYEYNMINEESSSEEITDEPKRIISKLTYHNTIPNLPEGIIIPENSQVKIVREEKKIFTVKKEEIKDVLDEIVMKMRVAKLPKSKLLSKVFGNDFNADEGITIGALADTLSSCSLNVGNKEKNYLLARFLMEPEGVSEIVEKSLKDLKSDILLICKRFSKLFIDWEVFTEEEVQEIMNEIHQELGKIKDDLYKRCQDHDKDKKGFIDFSVFRSITEEAGVQFSDREWEIWKLEIYPLKDLNYVSFINSLKSSRSPDTCLKIISAKLNTMSEPLDVIFTVSSQGLITAESFIETLNNLNINLSNEENIELLESLKHQDNRFTMQVHFNELYKLLVNSGYSKISEKTKKIQKPLGNSISSSSSSLVSSGKEDD
ncbi:hypothetical protein SteCoe_4182 [Stentor coeruleus]|uniref:EF-hand domain-containing protein n=1 Tax=Stentor coeruleus TaxID=5963 RepID=A0A1R2CVG1_9CILI|nr:hypothetical protein SteCoe_4182 [Stentor coeruleus]